MPEREPLTSHRPRQPWAPTEMGRQLARLSAPATAEREKAARNMKDKRTTTRSSSTSTKEQRRGAPNTVRRAPLTGE
jgi:hypothetical protein